MEALTDCRTSFWSRKSGPANLPCRVFLGGIGTRFLYNRSESCVHILGDSRIASLLFAEDVVLLASLDWDV